MDQIISGEAIIRGLETIIVFAVLSILPLLIVMLLKRNAWQHPLIRYFNNCIRHGLGFGEGDCQRVDLYIQSIENCFYMLKGETLTLLQTASPLNVAFKALPLLHYMSKSNTCCALHDAQIPPFKRTFACKQKIEELLKKWSHDKQLPLVAEEIESAEIIFRKIEKGKFVYQFKIFVLLLVYLISSFLITDVIIHDTPAWEIKMAAYFISLLALSLSYDYYYSQRYKRYRGNRLIRRIKK